MSERDDLITACRALAVMLRGEYGQLPVSEIVETWGVPDPFSDQPLTGADLEAVKRVEHLFTAGASPAEGEGETR